MNMNEIENIILGMAEIVHENRYLKKENEKLNKQLNEYYKSISKQCINKEQQIKELLRIGLENCIEIQNNNN